MSNTLKAEYRVFIELPEARQIHLNIYWALSEDKAESLRSYRYRYCKGTNNHPAETLGTAPVADQ